VHHLVTGTQQPGQRGRACLWRGGGSQGCSPARVMAAVGPVGRQHQPGRRCNLLCMANTTKNSSSSHPPSSSWLQQQVHFEKDAVHNTDNVLDTDLQRRGNASGGGVAAADDRLPSLVRLPTLGQQVLRRTHNSNGRWGPAISWGTQHRLSLLHGRANSPSKLSLHQTMLLGEHCEHIVVLKVPEAGAGRPAGAASRPAGGPGCAAARCRPAALQHAGRHTPQDNMPVLLSTS
jgi:hypothetical protein